jgi:hypothetical protein
MRPASRSSLTSSGSYSVTWSGVICGMACALRRAVPRSATGADCTSRSRSGARDQRFGASVINKRRTRRSLKKMKGGRGTPCPFRARRASGSSFQPYVSDDDDPNPVAKSGET